MISGSGAAPAAGLLEREAQRAHFARRAEAARAGAGSVLVLEGPAGIGKTALLRDLVREARGLGMRVVTARGGELERDHAFGAALQWVEGALRGLDEEERAAALAGAAALVGELLEGGSAPPAPAAGTGFPLMHGLYWLAANLAERRPMLLALDDAHWADEPTLRFVAFLARRVAELPVLVLLSARPDESPPTLAALADDPDVEALPLAPLGDAAGAALLAAELGRPPDPAFAAACRRATGGSPLLLHELARSLRARGIAPDAGSAVLIPDLGPEPLARSLRARLAGLPAGARALARALAVLEEADLGLAGALAGLDPEGAAAAAHALTAAGILEGGHPARFLHPILRAAAAASLAPAERGELHARAADLLRGRGAAVEQVAGHLLAAPPRGDRAAAADLRAAGGRALARGAPAEAAVALARALDEPPEPADRAELLLALGHAERALGRPAAAERFRRVAETAADPRVRAQAADALPWALGPAGAGAAEAALVDRAIADVEPLDGELALELLGTRIAFGLLDRSLAVPAERLSTLAGLAGATPARVALLAHVARELMELGRSADEAAAPAERAAAETAARAGMNPDALWLLNLFVVLNSADRQAVLAPVLEWALAASRERGLAGGFGLAARLRATAALRAGRVADAEAEAWSALDAGLSEPYGTLMPLAPLIGALIEGGRADEAWDLLAERDLAGELPSSRPFSVLLLERAWLRQERGDLEGALADLGEARRRIGREGASPVAGLDGRLREVEVLRLLARAREAREAAADALARARRWGTPGHVGSALRATALLEDGEDAIAGLRAAAASLERSPARLELARALIDLGAALRRAGRRSDAREPLRAALALTGNGAEALATRAQAELAASGVRAARAASGGAAALTPSERRITEMAAGGLGNPEIAQALFVTRKTIEMHLGNAYRKLGIRSRAALAAALDETGASGGTARGLEPSGPG